MTTWGSEAQDGGSTGKPWAEATVLHIDMDAFFASVEVLKDPSLKGLPVLVGGIGPRGVVSAASYEARVFGARSAMPMSTARRLCPDAVVVSGDHGSYRQISRRIMGIFSDFTPLVEPLSLDEAFLDVSSARGLFGAPEDIGHQIRQRILDEEGLRCSVGVACTKHVAKLASSAAKPQVVGRRVIPGDGVLVVTADDEPSFLRPLPIRAMWGIGPKTAGRLARLGVTTVGEVADLDVEVIVACLGEASGRHLHDLANGCDERAVESDRPTKSISHETTFPYDLGSQAEVDGHLTELADAVSTRLRKAELFARTLSIKVRVSSFETMTRSRTMPAATASSQELRSTAKDLMAALNADRQVLGQGIRLLGIAASGLSASSHRQLSLGLDDATEADGRAPRDPLPDTEIDGAVDAIRSKFGTSAIGRGRPRF